PATHCGIGSGYIAGQPPTLQRHAIETIIVDSWGGVFNIRKINSNYNFWKYAEVLELNQHTVTNTRPEFLNEDGVMRVAENEANSKRKSISVFNTVERLNKHPSVFINYLRALANAKGMTFNIQYPPAPTE
ncbi:MAG: hypothetical protein ACKPKO_15635, partial [Candidatus Fonsibacter sp.]